MPAESSYLVGLGRRILRLLSGVIVAVVLLLIFERIHLVDALLVVAAGVGASFFLLRREGRAINFLRNYFRAKAGADNPANFTPSKEQGLRATEFDDTELTELIWTV